ncbi:MAG: CHAD domain-containing protein [Calditrichaceae bacterium]|nr:CHAD domain-containing protein [Calditrichaceae bacterium]MBN2707812.1 CHAD domain-containing protein [Calditrichaceae bacterium]
MKNPRKNLYYLHGAIQHTELLYTIRQSFILEAEKRKRKQIKIFDSFDQRLFQKNKLLCYEDNTWKLLDLTTFQYEQKSPDKPDKKFYWQFCDKNLCDYLKDILNTRALIEKAIISYTQTIYHIKNSDKKTVARLRHFELEISDLSLPDNIFLLEEVRGYQKSFDKLGLIITDLAINEFSENNKSLFTRLLGMDIEPYSNSFSVNLKPEMSAATAIREIMVFLTNIMRKNEEGISLDIDTEFLHDYRVAIRRVRTILSEMKSLIPNDQYEYFKTFFIKVLKISNVLRDLDVLLLKKDSYRDLLPLAVKDNSNFIFKTISKKRTVELKKVKNFLKSTEYEQYLWEWQDFINRLEGMQINNEPLSRYIDIVARQRIEKKINTLQKKKFKFKKDVSPQVLHELRIETKKLKYMLEAFRFLYPENTAMSIINNLKKIQDRFGLLHDLLVQQNLLDLYFNELDAKGKIAGKEAAAFGALINLLNQQYQSAHRKSINKFHKFIKSGDYARLNHAEMIEERL